MKILTDPRSGSYQGITSSRNRFGQYVRTRATPVQPRTPKQQYNRTALTAGSSAWRTLTSAQQNAWNDYAGAISRTDSLGSSYTPTGASLFTGSRIASQGNITNPPIDFPTYVLQVLDVVYTDPTPGPEALEVSFVTNSADNLLTIETSGPVSPGITSSASVRRWRSVPATVDNMRPAQFGMTSPVDFIQNYQFLFPSPISGQVIWFRFRELFMDSVGSAIANKATATFRLLIP